MLEYNLIFFGTLFFLFANLVLRNNRFELITVLIIYTAFFLLAGFRLDISSDYSEYKYIFEKIGSDGGFSDYFIEPGYIIFNKFIYLFSSNFNVLLLVIAFLSIGAKICFINLFSKDRCLSLLIFLSFYLLLYDLGAVRRGIALGFCALSIIFFIKENIIISILFILLGALFHSSLLALLPFVFIKKVKISATVFLILIALSYFLQYLISNLSLFQFLNQSNNVIVLKAFGYFESGDYFSNNTVSIGFILRIFIVFMLIKRRDIINLPYFDKLLFFYAISIFVLIIFDKLTIFTSIAIYFKIVEVVLIPSLIYSFKIKTRFAIYIMFLIYLYGSFYKLISNPLETDFYPYRSILY